MEGKADEFKGRVKEAAGDLTDDDDLKAEGKTDKAGGKLKQGLEDAKDKGEELVDKVKDKVQRDR
ncbi:MAG: CsbD family protein [Acidimicrobiia bacterium]